MSVYVIGDLHLSTSVEKPMDVFGSRWSNYMDKIRENWINTVKEDDSIIIAGDISWAINLEELKSDFEYIESLPGTKYLLRGNHDYWWDTMAKLELFMQENNFKTIKFIQNNAHVVEDFIICGSRGWYDDQKEQLVKNGDNQKIIAREVCRLELSLTEAKRLQNIEGNENKEIIAFLHFPAYFKGYMCDEIIAVLYKYGIERCYYGHIHGNYEAPEILNYADIDFILISADYQNFKLKKINKK